MMAVSVSSQQSSQLPLHLKNLPRHDSLHFACFSLKKFRTQYFYSHFFPLKEPFHFLEGAF
jgi:hypothetical protein